jgi:hypothetical protein
LAAEHEEEHHESPSRLQAGQPGPARVDGIDHFKFMMRHRAIVSSILNIVSMAIFVKLIIHLLETVPCSKDKICWDVLNISQLSILTIFLTAIGILTAIGLNFLTTKVLDILLDADPTTYSHISKTDDIHAKVDDDSRRAESVDNSKCTVNSGTFLESLDLICRMGAILVIFFVCDKTTLIPRAEKRYDRGQFVFLLVSFGLTGLASTRRCAGPAPQDEILGREQTEEWKGWMQAGGTSIHIASPSVNRTRNSFYALLKCRKRPSTHAQPALVTPTKPSTTMTETALWQLAARWMLHGRWPMPPPLLAEGLIFLMFHYYCAHTPHPLPQVPCL